MNWIDMILVIMLIKNALQGFSKGFVVSIFKMIGTVVALYIGVFYRDWVVEFLKAKLSFDQFLSYFINPKVPNMKHYAEVMTTSGIVDIMLSLIGFLFIFIVVRLAFLLPAFFVENIIKTSKLSTVNRILGLTLGLARCFLSIALISAIITPFTMISPGGFLEKGITESFILMHIKSLDIITPVVIKLI